MNRSAFTLLELLLATVLSTMLMLGVLAVVAGLGQSSEALADTDIPADMNDAAINACIALMRDDLRHAMAVAYSPRGDAVIINGYSDMGSEQRDTRHRPVQIAYKLERIDGRIWLVRRQRRLDLLTNQTVQRELVATGLTRFALTQASQLEDPSRLTVVEAKGPDLAEALGAAGSVIDANPVSPGIRPPDPDENIFVARLGNYFYRRYIPDWVNFKAGGAGEVPDDASPQVNTGTATGPAQQVIAPLSEQHISQTAWRLKVWTDDADEPTTDRLIAFVTGGGR